MGSLVIHALFFFFLKYHCHLVEKCKMPNIHEMGNISKLDKHLPWPLEARSSGFMCILGLA